MTRQLSPAPPSGLFFNHIRTVSLTICLLAQFGFSGAAISASIDDSLKVVTKTTGQSIASQTKIDELSMQTKRMLEEYQRILRNTEYQDAYNAELGQLNQDQQAEISSLSQQLNDLKVTQMQIMPLIRTMADSLQKFVVLDLPFHQDERVASVIQLNQRLRSPSLSTPEKFRLILEAFQVENDYSYSIESYRGPLTTADEELSVEYLRIGRVGLYYLTLDGSQAGYWNDQVRNWEVLEPEHNKLIVKALRVAADLQAPELLSLPMIGLSSQQEVQP